MCVCVCVWHLPQNSSKRFRHGHSIDGKVSIEIQAYDKIVEKDSHYRRMHR